MKLCGAGQMRDADDAAIHKYGIPSVLLMRNAAAHVARAALSLLSGARRAAVFCGTGNNGGDGVAAAAFLLRRGVEVRVFLLGDPRRVSPDFQEMARGFSELGGEIEAFLPGDREQEAYVERCGALIDALYGTGLSRALAGDALAAVRLMNGARVPVVAADIPSGVEADTGRVLGEAVRADITVTFSMAKPGHFVEPGCTCRGELRVMDIGIPRELLERCGGNIFAVGKGDVALPKRNPLSHKGDYGRLLIVGGSVGYTGAPTLAAKAAVRAGAGLVTLGVPQEIYGITAVKSETAMPFPLPSEDGKLSTLALAPLLERQEKSDVLVLGMGLGRSAALTSLILDLVRSCVKPLVLDADGLYAVSGDLGCLSGARGPVVLTPHEGEFLRLGGVQGGDRVGCARVFAQEHNCVLALKGHRTLCAFPDGEVYVIDAGNPGMAKGGSGDALAGVLGAMLCQLPLKEAVVTGCWLHARAGDLAAAALGEYSMTAGDLIDALGAATRECVKI